MLAQKRPKTICRQIRAAVSQENFIYKNGLAMGQMWPAGKAGCPLL